MIVGFNWGFVSSVTMSEMYMAVAPVRMVHIIEQVFDRIVLFLTRISSNLQLLSPLSLKIQNVASAVL